MAINTVKYKQTGGVRLSLQGTEKVIVERYRAWATGDHAAGFRPIDAIGITPTDGPRIPMTGEPLEDDQDLICQTLNADYIPDSHTAAEYVLTYSARRFNLSWPSDEILRKRIRIASEQTRVFTASDGSEIGSPYYETIVDESDHYIGELYDDAEWINPYSDVGITKRATKTLIDVEILCPFPGNWRWELWNNAVNSHAIFNSDPGTVQYIGCDMEEQRDPATQETGYYTGTLYFLKGKLLIYTPDSQELEVLLHQRPDIRWRKRIDSSTKRITSEIESVTVKQVHKLRDLRELIPGSEPG